MASFQLLCGSQPESSAVLTELAALLPSAEQQLGLQSALQAAMDRSQATTVASALPAMRNANADLQPFRDEGGMELSAQLKSVSVAESIPSRVSPVPNEGPVGAAGSLFGAAADSGAEYEQDGMQSASEDFDIEAPGSMSSRCDFYHAGISSKLCELNDPRKHHQQFEVGGTISD